MIFVDYTVKIIEGVLGGKRILVHTSCEREALAKIGLLTKLFDYLHSEAGFLKLKHTQTDKFCISFDNGAHVIVDFTKEKHSGLRFSFAVIDEYAPFRQTGRTTQQIKDAPLCAVFICANHQAARQVQRMAAELGRSDLKIKPLSWLRRENLLGYRDIKIVMDHDALDMADIAQISIAFSSSPTSLIIQ